MHVRRFLRFSRFAEFALNFLNPLCSPVWNAGALAHALTALKNTYHHTHVHSRSPGFRSSATFARGYISRILIFAAALSRFAPCWRERKTGEVSPASNALNKISILNAFLFPRFSAFLINSRGYRGARVPRSFSEQIFVLENFEKCQDRGETKSLLKFFRISCWIMKSWKWRNVRNIWDGLCVRFYLHPETLFEIL